MSKGYLPPLIKGNMTPVEFLAANGYLDEEPDAKIKDSDPIFQRATMAYQEFAGLIPDGDFGPVSMSRASEKRCALPDLNRGFVKGKSGKWCEFNVEEACQRKWGDSAKDDLTCCHSLSFSSLSLQELDRAWWQGFAEWMKACDVTFRRIPFSKSANFTHEKESIDGSSGTLAYHYLPNCDSGAGTSLAGRYDSGERWTANFFQGVHVHECGHGLGLIHSSNRNDILYPYYNSAYKTPQPGDVRRVAALYGKPRTERPDPPTGPTGEVTREEFEDLKIQVQVNNAAIKILAQR